MLSNRVENVGDKRFDKALLWHDLDQNGVFSSTTWFGNFLPLILFDSGSEICNFFS